jgi:hypothetical protein
LVKGARANGRGFLAGLTLGLLLAVCAAVVLALIFPPDRLFPPRMDPGADASPAAPAAPARTRPLESDRPDSLLPPPALSPLVPDIPPFAPVPAELPRSSPPQAPEVFDGGEAGSPSLFPQ